MKSLRPPGEGGSVFWSMSYNDSMKTYELLSEIATLNPTITHFSLRLYHAKTSLADTTDVDFKYEWFTVAQVPDIRAMIQTYENQGWSVGLTSMVMTADGIQHLLMIDFLADHDTAVEGDLIWKLSTFNQSGDVPYKIDGYLIKTNNSYHYLGKYITSQENFINFLGSALLFRHSGEHYVIDDIWLGRSVKRRFGAIRLGQKEGIYPEIISEIK